MTKMIPPVPTSAVMLRTPKQKIDFSIASIVGNDAHAVGAGNSPLETGAPNNNNNCKNVANNDNKNNNNNNSPSSPPQTPPAAVNMPPNAHAAHMHFTAAQQHAIQQHLIMQQQQQQQHQQQQQQQHQQMLQQQQNKTQDIQDLLQRLHNSAAAAAHLSQPATYSPPTAQTRLSPAHEDSTPNLQIKRSRSPMSDAMENAQNPAQRLQPPHTPPKSESPHSSTQATPPPPPPHTHNLPVMSPQFLPKPAAMLMPGMPPAGLVRPFPMGPAAGPPPPGSPLVSGPQQGLPDIKALPPYINAPPEMSPQHPNPHLFAAAQFQMAAALQAGHVLGAAGLPPHGAPFMPGPGMPRESYPLYPWLLSRHGRLFPHRFPGNFLLQPFRKPKRIRTAFSPSQLLKLEHAFESNQYVVGAERKALAQSLNLSETQVKVWFQNRRTKHKRMQQEDEKGGSGNGSSGDRNSQNTSFDEEDDELIDMEMDECASDEEHELDASH